MKTRTPHEKIKWEDRLYMKKNHFKKSITGYLFVLPQFLFFAVFTIYPVFEGFRISLYKDTAVSSTFVGLGNYVELFSDAVFAKSILNTLFLVFVVTAVSIVLGIIISLAVFDKGGRYISFIRTCYYLPVVVSTVVMAMVWSFLLNPANGLIPYLLRTAGQGNVNLLGNPKAVLWIIAFVTIIASLGTCLIMYIASMLGISTELLEAAKIDGATKVQQSIHIVIPLVRPTTMYLTITQVIAMLKLFVIIQLLTDGGPNNASMTMMYYLYRNAFKYDKINSAAAIGVLMFVFALAITLPQSKKLAGIEEKKKRAQK